MHKKTETVNKQMRTVEAMAHLICTPWSASAILLEVFALHLSMDRLTSRLAFSSIVTPSIIRV